MKFFGTKVFPLIIISTSRKFGRIPENRGAEWAYARSAPLFSGFFKLFRDLLIISVIGLVTIPAIAAPLYEPRKIDEGEYWKLVQDSLVVIQRLEGLSAEEAEQALAGIAIQWKPVNEVEVDGQPIPVNGEYLSELMLAQPPDVERIEAVLNSLWMAHETFPQNVFSSADLGPLHKILSRAEFVWPEDSAPNPVNEWFQKIWASINRWLNDFFDRTLNISVNQNLFTLVVSILLALIFYFMFRTLLIDFSKEARLQSDAGEEQELLTSESAFEKAHRLSRDGDYRSAVRYLYLSALLIMDERGILRYDRSKTNREYLRSVAGAAELAEPLGEVIEVFDNVWYGYHSLDEASFDRYSNLVGELKEKKA